MRISIDKARFKLYLKIGVAYLSLWLFTDLINYAGSFLPRFFNNIWLVSYLVVLNFILLDYILPYIKITWGRMLVAPFLLFAVSMLLSFGFYGWRNLGIAVGFYTEIRKHASLMKGVEFHFPYAFFSVFFFGIIKYTHDFRKLKESAQKWRLEKQQAELNYLKSQTNPHFLFNTLNNIYSLSRDKSDLAPESILRLSKILRFMLYETSGDYIAIEQEVKIITDYIALEKLRYDETLRINFHHDIEDMKQALPPLLMIPLVENAFKHGVSETRNQPFIDIHLSVRNRQLTFSVKNSTEKLSSEGHVKENIGLTNLRRQLELLFTDYKLSLQDGESAFTATLKINLASHV